MMFPTPMKQLVAVVLEHDIDSITKVLLEEGVMHFISIRDLAGAERDQLKVVEQATPQSDIAETRKRIESLLKMADMQIEDNEQLDIEKITPVDLEKTHAELDRLSAVISEIRTRQSEAQQELLKLQDIQRQVELYELTPLRTFRAKFRDKSVREIKMSSVSL